MGTMRGRSTTGVSRVASNLRGSKRGIRSVAVALTLSALTVVAMPALASNATVRSGGVHATSSPRDCDPGDSDQVVAHHDGDTTTTDLDDVCQTTTTTTT